MLAVRGPRKARIIVTKVLPVEKIGPVGEDYIVLLAQAFFGEIRGRDEKNGPGAQLQEEGRAVAPGDFREAPVKWFFEKVDVADEWEGRARAGRKVSEFVEEMVDYGVKG